MIINELINYGKEKVDHRTITDVRMGLGFTAISLSDGSCGMAFSATNEFLDHYDMEELSGRMAEVSVQDMIDKAASTKLEHQDN